MITLQVDVRELIALEQWFGTIERDGRDQKPALEAARDEFEDVISEKFAQEGPGWAAHSPITTALRADRGTSGPVLQEDGDLLDSFMHGESGHFERWTTASFETGSALSTPSGWGLADVHEHGFRNRGVIPATSISPRIRMKGKPVPARPLLVDFSAGQNRMIDKYEDVYFSRMGI